MNYIFYQTKTMFSNTGDALINKSLISKLREYGKLYANCSPSIPSSFIEQLGITTEEQIKTNNEIFFALRIYKIALLNIFTTNNVFIFSGLGHTYGDSFKKILRNLIAGLLFPIYRMLGIHIIRIGLSIGPISKGLAITEFIRSLFVSKYYVRDTMSLKLCHDIGIKKAQLCPDMSWLYKMNEARIPNNSNIVILNLRNSTFDEFISSNYINTLIRKCKILLHTIKKEIPNLEIIITYQVADDRDFCIMLNEELKKYFQVTFVDKQMNLTDVEYYYGKSIFNISNRMHSLLLGYKFGSLPIALLDRKEHTKISSTFEDCNLPEFLFDIYSSENDLRNQMSKMIRNKNNYYSKLISAEKKQQKLIIQILDSILN